MEHTSPSVTAIATVTAASDVRTSSNGSGKKNESHDNLIRNSAGGDDVATDDVESGRNGKTGENGASTSAAAALLTTEVIVASSTDEKQRLTEMNGSPAG